MKKNLFFACSLVAMTLMLLTSCSSDSDKSTPKYYAIQTEDGEAWSIIDEEGNVVVDEEYEAGDALPKIYGESYWVKSNGKFQLYSIKSPKKSLTSDEWDNATDMYDGRALVSMKGEPIQVIDEEGKIVATLGKDIMEINRWLTSNFTFRKSDGKYGWADKNGRIIKEGLAYIEGISDGKIGAVAFVKEGAEKYTIFDAKGNETGTFAADQVILINEEYIGIVKDEKAYVLDQKGEVVIESKKYSAIRPLNNGYCVAVKPDGMCALLNMKGEELIRAKYSNLYALTDKLFAAMKDNGKVGVINQEDETIIDFEYNDIAPIGKNLLMKDNKEWIVVGYDGNRIGKLEFVNLSIWSPCNTKIGYINVDNITEAILSVVPEFDTQFTVDQVAKKVGVKPSKEFDYNNTFSTTRVLAGQEATVNYTFDSVIVREGYDDEYSDGWIWATANLHGIAVIFGTIDTNINQTIEIIADKLEKKGYEKSDYYSRYYNGTAMSKDGHLVIMKPDALGLVVWILAED